MRIWEVQHIVFYLRLSLFLSQISFCESVTPLRDWSSRRSQSFHLFFRFFYPSNHDRSWNTYYPVYHLYSVAAPVLPNCILQRHQTVKSLTRQLSLQDIEPRNHEWTRTSVRLQIPVNPSSFRTDFKPVLFHTTHLLPVKNREPV